MNNKVLNFIENFKRVHKKEIEVVFTEYNCYWFAYILKTEFKGSIYYLPYDIHFVCLIDGEYYDINGRIDVENTKYSMETIKPWELYFDSNTPDIDQSILDKCVHLE